MAAKDAFLLQGDVDPWRAVSFTVLHVGDLDLIHQPCVGLGSLAHRAPNPRVIPAL